MRFRSLAVALAVGLAAAVAVGCAKKLERRLVQPEKAGTLDGESRDPTTAARARAGSRSAPGRPS